MGLYIQGSQNFEENESEKNENQNLRNPPLPVMVSLSCDVISASLSLCGLLLPTLGLSPSLLVDSMVDAEIKYLNKFIILYYFTDITMRPSLFY